MLKYFSRLNLSQIFIAFLLFASLLPTLVIGITSYQTSRVILVDTVRESTSALVKAERDYLDLALSPVEARMREIAAAEDVTRAAGGEAGKQDLLEAYADLPGLVSLELYTAGGEHLFAAGPAAAEGTASVVAQLRADQRDQLIAELLQSGCKVCWTRVEGPGAATAEDPNILTAAIVVPAGASASGAHGLLLAHYSAETLVQHWQTVDLGKDASFLIVDMQNGILYHSSPSQVDTALPASLALRLKGAGGSFEEQDDRQKLIVTYDRSQHGGWTVIGITPVDSLASRSVEISLTTFLTMCMAFLTMGAGYVLIHREVVLPVRQIIARFQALQKDQDADQTPLALSGRAETHELVQWFNRYLDSLKARRQVEDALRDSEGKFRSLVENTGDWVWQVDADGMMTYCSPNCEAMIGFRPEEILGKTPLDLVNEPDNTGLVESVSRLIAAREGFNDLVIHFSHRTHNQRAALEVSAVPVFDKNGVFTGYNGACRDVTERFAAEEALRESEERYALAVAGSNDGIWDWDLRKNTIYYSPRWKTMLGYSADEITDSPSEWLGRVHPEDVEHVRSSIAAHIEGKTQRFETEYRIFHKIGRYRWVMSQGLAVRDEKQKVYRMAGSQTDISARKSTEERLRHDAMHDPLTSLPNRAYFIEQVKRAIEKTRRHGNYLAAVLFMDLDRFKIVNDSLGHVSGDLMLVSISQRLKDCLRVEDTVARFGGDEFAIMLDGISGIGDAIWVADRIQHEIARPFNLQGHEVFATVSIGIALTTASYTRPEDLLRDADTAMYRAKSGGRARYQIFDQEMHAHSMALLELEGELRRALERQEFELYYEPIISLQDGRVRSVEALVRWNHPQRGLVKPLDFIPLAEETGLINVIGEWVLKTACAQAKAWRENGFPDLRVAVNIAVRQFQDQNLPELVSRILRETGVSGEALRFEITESAAMKDLDATLQTIGELTSMGIQIAIDDFGTSYSSLGYLKRFPVSCIKIDRSFIQDVAPGNDSAALATAIIAIGHILGLDVIAEGIETTEQLDFLRSQQCYEVQGFLFDRPMPAAEMSQRLLSTYVLYNHG